MNTALVPFDPGAIEAAADPGEFIVLALERSKQWLTEVIEHGDIEQIVELKSQAEAIRIYTQQKQLGKDSELAAAEIVRRAERGIGVAIRRGQEAGEIRRRGQHDQFRGDHAHGTELLAPTDFLPTHELSSKGSGIYAMTDGVSDAEFEAALGEAKAEENLSRANVVRKAKAHNNDSTAERIEQAKAKHPKRELPAVGLKRLDANRIVSETVSTLEGLCIGVRLIEASDVDHEQVGEWVASLNRSLRSLRRFATRLEEATHG